jgi:hypothetical protein
MSAAAWALPAAVFFGLVVLALLVRPGASAGTDVRVRVLIAYVVLFSLIAGVTGRDLWPFAPWRFVRYTIGDSGSFLRVAAVDENGAEHALDPASFEPLELAELQGHLSYHLDRLTAPRREALLRFMLETAREGLRKRREGSAPGTFTRILGPLAAPVFQTQNVPWAEGVALPRELRELRVYRMRWRLHENALVVEPQLLVRYAA